MLRLLLATFAAVAAVTATAAPPSCDGLTVVRGTTSVTAEQKEAIIAGLYKMKSMTSAYDPKWSAWDYFVQLHRAAVVPGQTIHVAHNFFPWHRELINRFRSELAKAMGVNVTDTAWPYWDWTSDEATAALFKNDFLGGKGDPSDDYIVKDGHFTADNWHINQDLATLPGAKRSGGLVRAHGNGLQMCLDAAGRNFLLDTVYNPPGVDSLDVVNSFRLLNATGPPTDVMFSLSPLPTNTECPWNNHTCIRRYANSTLELQCKHYAATLPTVQDYSHCISSMHPYSADKVPAPINTEQPWKTTSDYYNNQSYWRACAEGVVPTDKYSYGLERIGASIHPPHGGVHTYLGGSVATPTSPNDPVFFGLHWNVDRLWAEYQAKFGNDWWLTGPGAAALDAPLPLMPNSKLRNTLDTKFYGYTYDTLCQ